MSLSGSFLACPPCCSACLTLNLEKEKKGKKRTSRLSPFLIQLQMNTQKKSTLIINKHPGWVSGEIRLSFFGFTVPHSSNVTFLYLSFLLFYSTEENQIWFSSDPFFYSTEENQKKIKFDFFRCLFLFWWRKKIVIYTDVSCIVKLCTLGIYSLLHRR